MLIRAIRAFPAFVLLWAVVATPVSAADVGGIDAVLRVGLTVSGTVVDGAGRPVAGAIVGVCNGPDGCFVVDAISGADGAYVIRGVGPGTYLVSVVPADGANLLQSWHGFGADPITDPGLAVAVEVVADVARIDIVIASGLRASGRVLSPEGDPVSGVDLGPIGGGQSARSASDGSFTIVGLRPGESIGLSVNPPPGSGYPRGYASEATVVPDYVYPAYAIGDSDRAGLDITLVRGRTISGHLAGAAAASVSVQAFGANDGGTAELDGSGGFELRGVWPGRYGLLFIVTETASDESQFPYGLYNGQDQVLASQYEPGVEVDTTSGDVTGLAATLPALPSISGVIRDAAGPFVGAGVQLCDPSLGCAYVKSGPDGTYKMLNAPNGSYLVQAGGAGHVSAWHATSGSTTDQASATPVVVAGASVSGVDVRLGTGATVRGRVTGPGGEPVAGAFVSALPDSGGISMLGPGPAITAPDGRYELTGLADGIYRVIFQGPIYSGYESGYWSPGGVTSDYGAAGTIEIRSGPTIVGRSPAPGAMGVSRNGSITITFSAPVAGVGRSTVKVRESLSGRPVKGSVKYSSSKMTATFRPADELRKMTSYEVLILPGITGTGGGIVAPETWSFQTGRK